MTESYCSKLKLLFNGLWARCSCKFVESVRKPALNLVIFQIACFGVLPCSPAFAQEIQVDAELELKLGTRDGLLTVTAEIPEGSHTYSMTQPKGGPVRSTLKLNGSGIQLVSEFVPQQEPEKHDDEFIGPIEELRGTVSWVAPVQISHDVKPAELQATVDLYAQICTDLTQQCNAPTTYSGEIKFLGERPDLELPAPVKEQPSLQSGGSDTQHLKLINTDTPEQIAAMASLYDVNEPIKYINFSEMSQFPIGPARTNPVLQTPLSLKLLLAFILGAIFSLMVYMLFNRNIETEKPEKQSDDQPVFPRMRRIAFAACLIFSICIVANVFWLIAETGLWTSSNETHPSATAKALPDSITWANWHPGKVTQQLSQNKIVWVNYTADWNPTCKLNEARVASNDVLIERMNKMKISFVAVDLTQKEGDEFEDFQRTDTLRIPVNFIYPPNYPEEPAIKLESLITASDLHSVLDRMETIASKLKE